MKYDTKELTGLALEFAAHKAIGTIDCEVNGLVGITLADYISSGGGFGFNWETLGPIISKERISLLPASRGVEWDAYIEGRNTYDGWEGKYEATGPTALVAAMRCLVIAKMGEEVDL